MRRHVRAHYAAEAPEELIVATSAQINDEVLATVPMPLPLTASYIAIAARTLGRCAAGTFILPEILCDAGLVMM